MVDADEKIDWYRENDFPLAPYSPMARGFFDGNSMSTYQSAQNKTRRERAKQLARKTKATPGQIALEWLLNQRFPVFPIIGTKNVARLRATLKADALTLPMRNLGGSKLAPYRRASHECFTKIAHSSPPQAAGMNERSGSTASPSPFGRGGLSFAKPGEGNIVNLILSNALPLAAWGF